MKNLLGRVNQQVTLFKKGTSETLREAISCFSFETKKQNNSNFDFTDYVSAQPEHKKQIESSFLTNCFF